MGIQRVTNRVTQKWQIPKANNGKKIQFGFCPHCGRKGYYKIPRSYEHCRYCGIHRILLPGQDF